jgi:hypothetical protein
MNLENRMHEGDMNLDEKLDILNEAADIVGGEMYEGYSGRGMFGERCYGITCSDPIPCVEAVAMQGITGANYDSMGLDYIVYWPNIRHESF